MQRFWSQLAVQLGKRAGAVSVVGLLITFGLGFGITQLKFATGTDSYLNADEQIYQESVRHQNRFGGEANITVITMDEGHTTDELVSNPKNRAEIERVSSAIREVPGIRGVVDPVVALQLSHNLLTRSPDAPTEPREATVANVLSSIASTALNDATAASSGADKTAREADLAATTARALPLLGGDPQVGDPEWTKFLLLDNQGEIRLAQRPVFRSDRHALLVARFDGNLAVDPATAATNRTVELADSLDLEHASVRTTGAPRLLVEINDYLRGGMLQLGGIALGIMVLILLFFFNVRWRLLPLFVVVIGVVWAFGLAGYLGIPLTLVTVAGLPILLGVGIDYAIQMHARVEEEAVLDRSDHPMQETARHLGPALVAVIAAAVAAFAALQWSRVPMLRQFGWLMIVGVVVICVSSIINPLAILGIREFRRPTRGQDFSEGAMGRFVVRLGGLPPAAALPLVVASIVIFVGGASVEERIEIETDPVQWINPDSVVIENLRYAEQTVSGASELATFVEADDVFADDVVAYVDAFTNRYLAANPEDLPVASSIVAVVSDLLVVPDAARAVPRGAVVEAAYAAAPADIQSSTFDSVRDGSPEALNVVFLAGPGSLADRKALVEDIRETAAESPDGIALTPSGLVVVGVGLLDNLEQNRILLTYLALGFVALYLTLRLRSPIRAVIALVPVLVAVGGSSLVAWGLGLRLSPMTAAGGPLIIAACAEFTTLIMLRYIEERGRGLDPQQASDVAAARTGRAFIVSALTTIAGVAVISLSSMPLLRDFGRVVGMNVAVALVSALVVLPPMLVWADRRGWISKGMLRHQEPFIDTPPAGEPQAQPG